MNASSIANQHRTIEREFEIQAPVEAVWKALTDAEELTRWFPMDANVEPGVGGVIRKSWRGEEAGEWPIEIWEPNKHLKFVWEAGGQDPAGDEQESAGEAKPMPTAVDYFLEGRGGSTVLRLVHSGFSADANWNEMFDGFSRGWSFELRGLRHYLENHLGTPRMVAWARHKLGISLNEAWDRLTGSDGLARTGTLDGKKAGERYEITTAAGDKLEGTVYIIEPPKDFCGTVDNMNRSLLRIHNDMGCGSDATPQASLWLSCYGITQEEVDGFERRYGRLLSRLYPEAIKS